MLRILRQRYLPGDEDDFVPLAGAFLLKLEVIDGPAALGLREIGEECVVVGIG